MYEYDEICIHAFLENQLQLLPKKIAETPEEAADFLEDCMAVVCRNIREVMDYFDECGIDISGMTKEEVAQSPEVFALPDGRFLVVEA